MRIITTSSLDKFKFHDNRSIRKSQVKKLMKEIPLHGQITPIMVTPEFTILDGQHRYLAIKLLNKYGTPTVLRYTVRDLSREEVASMNSTQAPWTADDWIEYHIRGKNAQYIALESLSALYPTHSMSSIATFTHKLDTILHTRDHKAGLYMFEYTSKHGEVLSGLHSLAELSPMFRQKAVLLAIHKLMEDPKFKPDILFKKLHANLGSIHKQSGKTNWFLCFKHWYNKGRHKHKITIDIPRRAYA
jgi:hypothetical protein